MSYFLDQSGWAAAGLCWGRARLHADTVELEAGKNCAAVESILPGRVPCHLLFRAGGTVDIIGNWTYQVKL